MPGASASASARHRARLDTRPLTQASAPPSRPPCDTPNRPHVPMCVDGATVVLNAMSPRETEPSGEATCPSHLVREATPRPDLGLHAPGPVLFGYGSSRPRGDHTFPLGTPFLHLGRNCPAPCRCPGDGLWEMPGQGNGSGATLARVTGTGGPDVPLGLGAKPAGWSPCGERAPPRCCQDHSTCPRTGRPPIAQTVPHALCPEPMQVLSTPHPMPQRPLRLKKHPPRHPEPASP